MLLVETDELELRERSERLLMDGYAVDAVGGIDQARVKLAEGQDALVLSSGSETIGLLRELRAGAIRRAGLQETRIVRVGSLTVDRDARTAQVDSRPVSLTRLEFDLLATLASESRGRRLPAGADPRGGGGSIPRWPGAAVPDGDS